MASFSSANEKNFWWRKTAKIQRSARKYGIFNFSFIPGLVRARWHDGRAVMLRHLVIAEVDIRLVAASPICRFPCQLHSLLCLQLFQTLGRSFPAQAHIEEVLWELHRENLTCSIVVC